MDASPSLTAIPSATKPVVSIWSAINFPKMLAESTSKLVASILEAVKLPFIFTTLFKL